MPEKSGGHRLGRYLDDDTDDNPQAVGGDPDGLMPASTQAPRPAARRAAPRAQPRCRHAR